MTRDIFCKCVEDYAETIEKIKDSAHLLHASVNQHYDGTLPYGYHLDMVVDSLYKYGDEVCACREDILPLFFGAYYHDSIEDARLTYNDVTVKARQFMDEEQAYMAAEIVYALTNDKGRTRAQRAGDNYYKGIRETPYAPFVKLADRLANITYSCRGSNNANNHMKEVYREELPHFLEAINQSPDTDISDPRFLLPQRMIDRIEEEINCTTRYEE